MPQRAEQPPPGPRRRQPPTRPVGAAQAGARLGELYAAAMHQGWTGLLELVLLGMIWVLAMFLGGAALVGTLLHHDGLVLIYLVLPLPLWGPATVGLHAAVDAIWSGEAIGPFDALRNFAAGFVHRYLRSVGLGALWVIAVVGTYANVADSGHILPPYLLGAMKVLLLYVVLFLFMVQLYLLPILATTGLGLWRAIRFATWQVLGNPFFTLGGLLFPVLVVLLGFYVTPAVPVLLLGGVIALFSTGALRFAPLRHPALPEPVWFTEPQDGAGADPGAAPSVDAIFREVPPDRPDDRRAGGGRR